MTHLSVDDVWLNQRNPLLHLTDLCSSKVQDWVHNVWRRIYCGEGRVQSFLLSSRRLFQWIDTVWSVALSPDRSIMENSTQQQPRSRWKQRKWTRGTWMSQADSMWLRSVLLFFCLWGNSLQSEKEDLLKHYFCSLGSVGFWKKERNLWCTERPIFKPNVFSEQHRWVFLFWYLWSICRIFGSLDRPAACVHDDHTDWRFLCGCTQTSLFVSRPPSIICSLPACAADIITVVWMLFVPVIGYIMLKQDLIHSVCNVADVSVLRPIRFVGPIPYWRKYSDY